jgi:hypothetical protein
MLARQTFFKRDHVDNRHSSRMHRQLLNFLLCEIIRSFNLAPPGCTSIETATIGNAPHRPQYYMTVPNPIKYLVRVWLTVLLLSPFIYTTTDFLYQYVKYDIIALNFTERIMVFGMFVLIGFLMSLPSFFLLFLFIFKLNTIRSIIWKKAIIAILALCLLCLTFWFGLRGDLINHAENNVQLMIIFAPYLVVTLTCVLLYKINRS